MTLESKPASTSLKKIITCLSPPRELLVNECGFPLSPDSYLLQELNQIRRGSRCKEMLSLALGSLSASPLLTSADNPSNSVLDSGVEAAAAPPRKPFGWDAYWGAADMHAGPSYSFARQRTKIADANARAQTRSVSASAPFVAALAYPPLGELMAVQTCMPLASQHV